MTSTVFVMIDVMYRCTLDMNRLDMNIMAANVQHAMLFIQSDRTQSRVNERYQKGLGADVIKTSFVWVPGISETVASQKTGHWAIFWKLFSFTAHGPLMRIKIMVRDSTSQPEVGRYSETKLTTCVTILQCTYRFCNKTAVLLYGLKRNL